MFKMYEEPESPNEGNSSSNQNNTHKHNHNDNHNHKHKHNHNNNKNNHDDNDEEEDDDDNDINDTRKQRHKTGASKLQGYVQVPAGAPGASHSDMLDWHQYAVYSRRQVCYIAALVAAGNQASNYDSGLSRLIPPTKCDSDLYQAGFKRALLGLLAACSVDPTLKDGAQGPVLVVAKSRPCVIVGGPVSILKPAVDATQDVPLSAAPLRTCRFRDGSDGNPPISDSISATPEAACQPTSSTPVDAR
eukprot:s3183_g3.t1